MESKDLVAGSGSLGTATSTDPSPVRAGSMLASLNEGIGNNLTAATTARSALLSLSYWLAGAQQQEKSLPINPEAFRGLVQWQLQECPEGLEDGDEM